jgi:OOP family OmpA-OmpF porin
MTTRILTAGMAVALTIASTVSFGADAITGSFFVNGNIGQSTYHVRPDGYERATSRDRSDTATSVRFGYVWHSTVDFGVEGGYVDLGEAFDKYRLFVTPHGPNGQNIFSNVDNRLKVKGFLLGVNGKYRFAGNWFVSAHGGWFRSRNIFEGRKDYDQIWGRDAFIYSKKDNGSSWYGGIGAGYDLTPNFSLGVTYDNYHVKSKYMWYYASDFRSESSNVSMYSAFAEYRFR